MTTAYWTADDGWVLVRPGRYAEDAAIYPPPTHWMPLPARPKIL
jgi:hypothetical protein